MRRREFVRSASIGLGASALGLGLGACEAEDSAGRTDQGGRSALGAAGGDADFTFAHLTDPHIQPELRAAEGCRQCFEQVTRLEPDFALVGGDLVFDVMDAGRPRATELFALWDRGAASLEMPLHHAVGNHDAFGINTNSGVAPTDPWYGKKVFEDRIGALYYSFDHKGWRFIVLDSIAVQPGPERPYYGLVDGDQVGWLEKTLAEAGPDVPVVILTHVPILTAFWSYIRSAREATPNTVVVDNSRELVDLFRPYNVKAVLQGHTHIRETIEYEGCKFITSGAISGDWWKGLRMGHPEGYGLLTVRGEEIEWEYRTYGWEAAAG